MCLFYCRSHQGPVAWTRQFISSDSSADSARRSSSTRLTVFTNLLHCVRINCYTSNRLFHLSIRQLGCQICGPPDTTQDTTTTGGFQFHTSQTWSRAAVGDPTTAGKLLRPPRDPFVAHLSASHFLDEQSNWMNIPKTRMCQSMPGKMKTSKRVQRCRNMEKLS